MCVGGGGQMVFGRSSFRRTYRIYTRKMVLLIFFSYLLMVEV